MQINLTLRNLGDGYHYETMIKDKSGCWYTVGVRKRTAAGCTANWGRNWPRNYD